MHRELVSIIIPTYNRASLLSRAIKSVINQTYSNWEALIIADNCTDDTSKVLDVYREDSKIQITELAENVGGAKARNIGLRKARGEYISFLDDDDEWNPEKIYDQIKVFKERNDICIVSCNYLKKTENGTFKSSLPEMVNLDKMLYRNVLGNFSCCVTKKEYVENIYIANELIACQDWDLWIKILLRTDLNGLVLSKSLVEKDNSHGFSRLTSSHTDANDAHWKFICNTKHIMNPTQKAYRFANYYSRQSRVHSDYKFYIKSLAYLLRSFYKTSLHDIITILYPFWLLGDNLQVWMKKSFSLRKVREIE